MSDPIDVSSVTGSTVPRGSVISRTDADAVVASAEGASADGPPDEVAGAEADAEVAVAADATGDASASLMTLFASGAFAHASTNARLLPKITMRFISISLPPEPGEPSPGVLELMHCNSVAIAVSTLTGI